MIKIEKKIISILSHSLEWSHHSLVKLPNNAIILLVSLIKLSTLRGLFEHIDNFFVFDQVLYLVYLALLLILVKYHGQRTEKFLQDTSLPSSVTGLEH